MEYRVSLSGESPHEKPFHDFAGIGLLRGEFILRDCCKSITTPSALATLQLYIEDVCRAFAERPVWYRMCDLWSDEASILDGVEFVEHEHNPIIGVRGIERTLQHKPSLDAELNALVELAQRYQNLHIIPPFIHDAEEFGLVLNHLEKAKWPNRIGSMIEVPSAITDAARLVQLGASNLLIGLNDLTCLILGRERGTSELKLHHAVWHAIDYFNNIIPAGTEWGVGGSLSVDLIAMSERSGAEYVTVHYAEIPSLLDINPRHFRDLNHVRNVKTKTRNRKEARLKRLYGTES